MLESHSGTNDDAENSGILSSLAQLTACSSSTQRANSPTVVLNPAIAQSRSTMGPCTESHMSWKIFLVSASGKRLVPKTVFLLSAWESSRLSPAS